MRDKVCLHVSVNWFKATQHIQVFHTASRDSNSIFHHWLLGCASAASWSQQPEAATEPRQCDTMYWHPNQQLNTWAKCSSQAQDVNSESVVSNNSKAMAITSFVKKCSFEESPSVYLITQ